MEQGKLRRACPACGLPAKVFEPYQQKISPRRSFILNLDLHPILVHFPQAFCSILPPLVIVSMLFPGFYGPELIAVVGFTSLVLPLTVVGALISGLIDAQTKLKKLSPPALVQKIAVGSSLLGLSIAMASIIARGGFQAGPGRIAVLLLSLASFGCAVLLGMMGKRLINAILPG